MTTSREPAMAAWMTMATFSGARASSVPAITRVGTRTWGNTARRSPAEARAIARKPTGWKDRILSAKRCITGCGVPVRNIVGSSESTNSADGSSDRRIA